MELLRRIAKDVADIKAAMAASVGAYAAAFGLHTGGGTAGAGGRVAGDADLDGQHGDPLIRKDPPRWPGESFAGQCFSGATPDYLDNLASFLEWKAGKNEADPAKKKYADYDRRDAARARGWAARLRAGWKPKSSTQAEEQYDDGGFGDEIPF